MREEIDLSHVTAFRPSPSLLLLRTKFAKSLNLSKFLLNKAGDRQILSHVASVK